MSDIPPSKTYTPGLEFTQDYGIDKQKQFDEHVSEAKSIIEGRLPLMAELQGIIELTLGGPYKDQVRMAPPIYIDARSEKVSVVDSIPEGAHIDTSFSIRPELIMGVSKGTHGHRIAIFEDARKIPTAWPRGDGPKACRFMALLAQEIPSLLDPKATWDPAELPKPTTDLEQVKRDITKWGFGFVKDALSPLQVQILKKAVLDQAAGEVKAGVSDFEGANQRLWNLINKGPEFIDLLNDPLIDELVPWYLNTDAAILGSCSANIAKKGGLPQILHRDQVSHGPPRWDIPFGLQFSYYLIDNSEDVGATRVVPKSHVGVHMPVDDFSHAGTVAAAAPAGTALVFDPRIWHGTGVNIRDDMVRPVILVYFARPHLRQHEAFAVHLRQDADEMLPPRQRAMLGYRSAGSLWCVKGPMGMSKGLYPRMMEDSVGRLRVDHTRQEEEGNGAVNGAVNGAANGAVNGAANGAANGAVNGKVNGEVNGKVNGCGGKVNGVNGNGVVLLDSEKQE